MSDTASEPANHDSLPPVAVSSPTRLFDPLPESGAQRSAIACLGAIGLHVGMLTFSLTLGAQVTRDDSTPQPSQTIEVELAAPAPLALPEPEPEQPAALAPPQKDFTSPTPAPAQVPTPDPAPSESEPPPAPAEAGQVLTAAAPLLDLSNTLVSGSAAQFAGGVTTSDGTSKVAVHQPNARSGGVLGGRGTGGPVVAAPPAPIIDRSRSPQLAGGARWDCPFPAEADLEQIDQAAVSLEVSVDPAGKVHSVTVKADPGFGFAREARRCALRKSWQPGLNRLGQPTGAVARVKVRFQR